ncbi:unnamed protein product [Trichogramma brassicae]|uniref:Reverse transcriptase domain-containing protein n=1 Tax=Trichogramma brassicae TaxID=86971 RepID=A0A6H5IGW3_9HYME|nr:unnamed protein product [Trichogramma brassicae]
MACTRAREIGKPYPLRASQDPAVKKKAPPLRVPSENCAASVCATRCDWLPHQLYRTAFCCYPLPTAETRRAYLFLSAHLRTVLHHCDHFVYADDTQIYAHDFPDRILELIAAVNSDAESIAAWASRCGLRLNPSKTTVQLLGSLAFLTKLKASWLPKIVVQGTHIEYSPIVKSLGVKLTPTLNWEAHTSGIVSRCHYALFSLRYYRHALSQSIRRTLAVALVLPHLDYAAAVYDSVTNEQNLRLQRVQNACVRFVFGSIPRTAHVTPYRLALGWLSVCRRRELRIALLALEILRSGSPPQLRDPFILMADHPEIRTSPRRIRPLVYYNAKRTGALTNNDISEDLCDDWKSKLSEIIKEYEPKNIFNADESGLFYKCMPSRTLLFKGEKCHGGKLSKERLTILFCANMTDQSNDDKDDGDDDDDDDSSVTVASPCTPPVSTPSRPGRLCRCTTRQTSECSSPTRVRLAR